MQEVFRAVLYAELDFARAPWDAVSAECRQLVQSLLQREPANRPTAAQALNHRYTLQLLVTGARHLHRQSCLSEQVCHQHA